MKTAILSLLAALSLGLAAPAAAQTETFDSSKLVFKSSAPAFLVQGSSQSWTVTDSPLLAGSDFVIIQSTYAGGKFAYAFESTASTQVSTSGGKSALLADRSNDGLFYEVIIRRWHQNLRVYTLGLDTATSPMLRVVQSK